MPELPSGGIVGEQVISGDAGITLREPPDRLADGHLPHQPSLGNPLAEFFHVGQEAEFLFLADRAVLGHPLAAGAEHEALVSLMEQSDPNLGFLLEGVPRRRLAMHFLEPLRVFEIVQPLVAFRLSRGDHVMRFCVAVYGFLENWCWVIGMDRLSHRNATDVLKRRPQRASSGDVHVAPPSPERRIPLAPPCRFVPSRRACRCRGARRAHG